MVMWQKTLFSCQTEELKQLGRGQMRTGADVGEQWEHMAENRAMVVAASCLVTLANLIWLLHNSLERYKLKW